MADVVTDDEQQQGHAEIEVVKSDAQEPGLNQKISNRSPCPDGIAETKEANQHEGTHQELIREVGSYNGFRRCKSERASPVGHDRRLDPIHGRINRTSAMDQ